MLRRWVEEARFGSALPFDVFDVDMGDADDITDDTIADITDDTNNVDDVVQKEKENIDEVAPASSMDSEETHGGNEATKDIEGSPNAADDGEEENEGAEQGEPAPDDSDNDDDYSDNDDDYSDDNSNQTAQRAFDLNAAAKKRLAAAFATVIGKVAEDLAAQIVEGDDEWDVDALMMRRFNRRSIYTCRQSREKQSVVLVLDTSGSCGQQASFYSEIADVASKRGDVVIYEAPNADTVAVCERGVWRQKEENEEWWAMKNRTILFFGDFDGGWNVIQASKFNKIYWFSNESRYTDTSEHDWCGGLTLSDFKGKYFPCFSEADFFNLIKKVR